ncbi:MAG: hypothetical protein V3V62_04425 [bacterium]
MAAAASANTRAEADTRYWDNLPNTIHALSLQLPPGEHSLRAQFRTKEGAAPPRLDAAHRFRVEKGKPAIVWLRSRRILTSK